MTLHNVEAESDLVDLLLDHEPHAVLTEESIRFRLMRLCPCPRCGGLGKLYDAIQWKRCPECRGEGRVLDEVATADTSEGVGTAIVTLSQEGEFDGCPFGLIENEPGKATGTWRIMPWPASPRTVSDAGKLLRSVQLKGEK